ncbi:MAG: hypothetical protein GVY36_06160 [Verrucomicrobia bacterium]|nr:hypothetical protein [Verrucomicrobiota bacterium]
MKKKWLQEFPIQYRATNIKFIHIGECAGTSLMKHFIDAGIDIDEYHLSRPTIQERVYYFLWIRNPLNRFVSAFNHAKTILAFDYSGLDPDGLNLSNCPAPERIRNRMLKGYTFGPAYDALIFKFSSANELAESLSSSDRSRAFEARQLMKRPEEHIYKGIGWYLDNGRWVRVFHRRIIMVGCVEKMDSDFARLLDTLGWPELPSFTPSRERTGAPLLPDTLSQKARRNLRQFYSPTDYAAISALYRHGLIDDDVFEAYNGNT